MNVLFPKRDNEQLHNARQYLRREIRNVIKRYGDNITGTALHDVHHEFKIDKALRNKRENGNEYNHSGTDQGVL